MAHIFSRLSLRYDECGNWIPLVIRGVVVASDKEVNLRWDGGARLNVLPPRCVQHRGKSVRCFRQNQFVVMVDDESDEELDHFNHPLQRDKPTASLKRKRRKKRSSR
ncbi:hypothetical protein HN358_01050 [Candidatus Uhrbacteria bacterium]|nr:hypothetical protein [Candidatus Uhrbacteria bacterium]MBT7717471.1 hypothetical protein [Candidatus Uhrbacteria bacterium]